VKIVDTSTLTPESFGCPTEGLWLYNGLDCFVTLEVFEELIQQLDEKTSAVYNLSRALMAPILEMNMRGVLIDQEYRDELISAYRTDLIRLEENFNLLVEGVFERPISWRSNDQLKCLFYSIMRIPEIRKKNNNGEMRPTVDETALNKLAFYYHAAPFVRHILAMRDIGKKLELLATSIDFDSRVRTSFNIAGTNTGRLSSSFSDFGTGRNLQNIEERLRRIFVADPGMKFANIDLEQADSRNIGAWLLKVFNDSTYLDACESGDLHTTVAKMSYPDLPWPGNLKEDRALAENTSLHRGHSIRHGCKQIGHGSNYYGKPFGIAQATGIDKKIIEAFQPRYFTAFPAIPNFHQWVRAQLQSKGVLENLFERPRHFAGRLNDESTLREAIAFTGQSSTADYINHAMLAVWRLNNCQLLLQVHDSLLIQYPEKDEDTVLPQVLAAMNIKIPIRGREFSIPCEAKVGWNWSNYSVNNLDGLKKYGGHDERQRQRQPKTSLLARRFS